MLTGPLRIVNNIHQLRERFSFLHKLCAFAADKFSFNRTLRLLSPMKDRPLARV